MVPQQPSIATSNYSPSPSSYYSPSPGSYFKVQPSSPGTTSLVLVATSKYSPIGYSPGSYFKLQLVATTALALVATSTYSPGKLCNPIAV